VQGKLSSQGPAQRHHPTQECLHLTSQQVSWSGPDCIRGKCPEGHQVRCSQPTVGSTSSGPLPGSDTRSSGVANSACRKRVSAGHSQTCSRRGRQHAGACGSFCPRHLRPSHVLLTHFPHTHTPHTYIPHTCTHISPCSDQGALVTAAFSCFLPLSWLFYSIPCYSPVDTEVVAHRALPLPSLLAWPLRPSQPPEAQFGLKSPPQRLQGQDATPPEPSPGQGRVSPG
jgi:hypothetical protein